MQSSSRRLDPLAIVLPHPQLPHRRPSLLSISSSSSSAASPHTPRSCTSTCLPPQVYYPANRKSSDSWNSSNADEIEYEWRHDQLLLLSRTLDALPAHLVTPFHGPVPPSNLLDKIARGVAQAKGPIDWPHSIRATRVKLLDLARTRAKEDALIQRRKQVIHEKDEEAMFDVEVQADRDQNMGLGLVLHHDFIAKTDLPPADPAPAGKPGPGSRSKRRPLYRQSSMDFIKPSLADIKDNPNITRLSNRLQRTDRPPSYHPYPRRRSSSPPHPTDVPALITPSSTTLNTLSSSSTTLSSAAAPRVLRRSASMLSSSGSLFSSESNSISSLSPGPLPPSFAVPRLRSSRSSIPPPLPPKDIAGCKRAPSYGALAQEAKNQADAAGTTHARKLSGSYPSSDEEEKVRSKTTKRVKTTADLRAAPVPPPKDKGFPKTKSKTGTLENLKKKAPPYAKPSSEAKSIKDKDGSSELGLGTNKKILRMNLQRNPSMFGAELPPLPTAKKLFAKTSSNPADGDVFMHDVAPGPGLGIGLSPAPTLAKKTPSSPRREPAPKTAPSSPNPTKPTTSKRQRQSPVPVPKPLTMPGSPAVVPPPLSPISPASPLSPTSPTSSKPQRTLRRVRRLTPGRRISFGTPGDDADESSGSGSGSGFGSSEPNTRNMTNCLGSAFQMA